MIKGKKLRRHSVNLFLFELIAVLLFFSISCAVILNVFSVANSKAEKSLLNEKIILCAQSVSEVYSSGSGINEVAKRFGGGGLARSGSVGSYALYFDKELKGVSSMQDADIVLFMYEEITPVESGSLGKLNYKFLGTDEPVLFTADELTEGGVELFSGSCSAYIPDFEVNGNE